MSNDTQPDTSNSQMDSEYQSYLSAPHVTEAQHERMIELSRQLRRGVFSRGETKVKNDGE